MVPPGSSPSMPMKRSCSPAGSYGSYPARRGSVTLITGDIGREYAQRHLAVSNPSSRPTNTLDPYGNLRAEVLEARV